MQKYLKFVGQVKQLNKRFDLSHYEIELLDMAAKAYFSEQAIFVGDLICQRSAGSQATLHAALKRLLIKKLLSTKPHEVGGRIKKVTLTKLAIEYYKRLNLEINRLASKKLVTTL